MSIVHKQGQAGALQTDREILSLQDAGTPNNMQPDASQFQGDTLMWSNDLDHAAHDQPVERVRPPTQPSGPNWAAPPPPSLPGMPARPISTPARLAGPPANTPIPNQAITVFTGGASAPGPRSTEQPPSSRATNLAAFSRFGCMLGLQPSDIELGQRLLSDVSRAKSSSPQFFTTD